MTKKNNLAKDALVGAGLVALAAAAAGTYFLYGSKNAAKNRKMAKAWAFKAKGEVLERMEKLKDVNEQMYHAVIKEVAEKYQNLKKLDKGDVEHFVAELKKHWKPIAREIKAFQAKNKKK